MMFSAFCISFLVIVLVLDEDAIAGAHGVQAWRRQGLSQKMAFMLFYQIAHSLIEIFCLPPAPHTRNVDVTFRFVS